MQNTIRKLALILALGFSLDSQNASSQLSKGIKLSASAEKTKKSAVVVLFEKKAYNEIISQWGGQALELNREDKFLLAQSYYYQNNHKQALRIYELMLQSNPNDAPAWRKMAAIYKLDSKYSLAISALKKAIEINPNYEPAYLELAETVLAYKPKSWYEVRMIYEDLVAKFGLKIIYQRAICDLAVKEGQHIVAQEACAVAIKLKPDDTEVLLAQVQLLKDLQQIDKAHEIYSSLVIKYPKDFKVQLASAEFFKAQGKKLLAIESYEKAIQLKPDQADLLLELAPLACEMQKWQLCLDKYEAICQKNKKIRSELRVRIKELNDIGATDFVAKFEKLLKDCTP